jgi:carbonic anhydrase
MNTSQIQNKRMRTHTKETQKNMTPADALQCLKKGNQRFVNNLRANRDLLKQVNETSDGQYPFAIVLSCIDSRTSAELIFDQGLGDIFSARVAGNVVNDDILGSMEYSCKVAGSKLVMVLGHTKCGAITSACQHIELGNITTLLSKIQPAVAKIERAVDDVTLPENVELVAHENVKISISEIRQRSSILRELEESGKIIITGGMYNIETGDVEFFD